MNTQKHGKGRVSLARLQNLLFIRLLLLMLSAFWLQSAYAQDGGNDAGNELVQTLSSELTNKSKAVRLEAIDTIAASTASRKSVWLQAILDGDLYVLKSTDEVVIASKSGRVYDLQKATDGSALASEKKRALRKIKVDNSMRTYLRSLIGGLALENDNPQAATKRGESIDR